MKLKKVMWQRN